MSLSQLHSMTQATSDFPTLAAVEIPILLPVE